MMIMMIMTIVGTLPVVRRGPDHDYHHDHDDDDDDHNDDHDDNDDNDDEVVTLRDDDHHFWRKRSINIYDNEWISTRMGVLYDV